MSTLHFDTTKVLEKIAQKMLCKKRKKYRRSRLEKVRAEIVALRRHGASYGKIALWLRSEKRINVYRTTVRDFAIQLPELNTAEVKHVDKLS